jgi:microcin C transport system substrate-binding protein
MKQRPGILILLFACSPFLIPDCLAAESSAEPAAPHWQHGLSIYGEFKYPPGFQHFDTVNPDAPSGGRLVRSLGYSFNNFTPIIDNGLLAPGSDTIAEPILYDSLLKLSADELGVSYGSLAEFIAVSDDMTEVRMKLRPQARWHDGVAVTALDVKFTFEHIRDNGSAGLKMVFLPIKQVEVISDKEVHFKYRHAVNLTEMMMLGKMPILPEHYWRERDITKTTTEPPLTSGPYRVGRFELGKFIEFERVADYWGQDIGPHRGSFNLDVLRFDVYRDGTVAREALHKGLIDAYREFDAAQWMTGYERQDLLVKEQYDIKQFTGLSYVLAFNLNMPRFQDVRVREALSLAYNFDWTNNVIDYGVYPKPTSFFHGSVLAATDLPSPSELALLEPFRDQLPAAVFTEPPWTRYSTSKLSPRSALARAQGLLTEAGWRHQDGSLVDASGNQFEIEFLITSAASQRSLFPYIAQLKRLGIEAHLRMVEAAQYTNLRRRGKAHAVIGRLIAAMPPSLEVRAYFSSKNKGPTNPAHVNSPVVDALIDSLLGAANRSELTTAGRALDRVLYWQFYFIPLQPLDGPRTVIWDKFDKPDGQTQDTGGFGGFPVSWSWNPEKAARVTQVLKQD